MHAVIHHSFGDPAAVLAVETVATPEPGPGEVRVRLLASPIHNHDLWTVRGTYGYRPELPARAGTEAVGVVDALGDGVSHLQVGQRVATGGTFGVWAEHFTAPAAGLLPVPDGLSDEVAAQLVAMPFSAVSLIDSLDLHEGDWMVQNAANGAVGRLVAQLGPARGVHVLGLVRRSAAVDELSSQGITDVVATDAPDWRERAEAIVAGGRVVAGVDSVGGPAAGDVASLLSENATLAVFGAMSDPTLQIPSGDVIFKQLVVKGFWGSKVSREMAAEKRAALMGEVIRHVMSGALTLPVAASFPLADVAAAATASLQAGRVGKVLLHP